MNAYTNGIIVMHPSVKKVAEFMQNELTTDEFWGVAEALATIAPALWGRYGKKEIRPLALEASPLICGYDKSPPV